MSVGAYTAANLAVQLGLPFWVTLPAGGLMAALIGAMVGIPSLRIKGLYLAIATLAGQLIIEWTINHVPAISGGAQASIQVPRPDLFGFVLNTPGRSSTSSCCSSRCWRSWPRSTWCAAASAAPSSPSATRTSPPRSSASTSSATSCSPFAISSFYAGVCGVLYTYYFGIANYEQFQIGVSIDYLAMIIIGGLGSVLGSIFGAVFVTLLPIVIRIADGERRRRCSSATRELANVISGTAARRCSAA